MLLEARAIRKSFGPLEVLKGVDFSLEESESVAVMGASGAGKSTLLQILGTLMGADSGSLSVCGRDVLGMRAEELAAFRTVGDIADYLEGKK